MIYGKAFSLLKKEFIKEWSLYTNHRFIKKLSNNTLEKKVFINYLKSLYDGSRIVYRLGYGPFKAESWVRFPDWEFFLALLAQLDSA